MPATITTKGYIRVSHNGFDDTLTAWRNKKLKDYPDTREWLCDLFNRLIFAGNFKPEDWFPKEKKKYLIRNICWQWHTHKAKRPSTLKQQANILKKHIIPHNGNQSIREITRQDFYWIRETWGDTQMAKQIRSVVAQPMLNWAWHEGMMDKQLFLPTIKVTKGPTAYIEIADRWEIHRRMPKIYQDAALLSIEMGMRIGEIVALKKDAVDLKRNVIRVIRSLSGKVVADMPKGGDEILLPFDMPYIVYTRNVLISRMRNIESQWVFSALRGGMIWPEKITGAFKSACREIGLPQARMHHCRNSFAQDRLQEYPMDIVQTLLGHKQQRTTEGYVGLGIRRLKKVREMR